MADAASGSAGFADITPQQSFDVQARLRTERDQIAFLNAIFSEGQPELLVGAIWDVIRAIEAAADQPAPT